MDEPTESHEVIVREPQGAGEMLARFMPSSGKELYWLAGQAAGAGMFGVKDQRIAFNIMMHGAHLGIAPYAALSEIKLIEGTPVVSAQLQAALIQQRGGVDPDDWVVDGDKVQCTVTFRARHWRDPKSVTVKIEDVPEAWKQRSHSQWPKDPEDMLFALCIRRIRKRYFPAVMIGLSGVDAQVVEGEVMDTTVVSVGTVEERLPGEVLMPPCGHLVAGVTADYGEPTMSACGKPTELVPGRSGGMFLRCTEGHMMPPPQAVRDAIRGHKEGTAAIQQEASDDGSVAELALEASEAPVHSPDQPDHASEGADGPPAEAPEPAVMGRKEVDEHVQAILTSLTAAKRTGHLEAAQTVLRAHGWDESPLTAWLMTHPEELPGLVEAFTMEEPTP